MTHTKISTDFKDTRDELGFSQIEMAEKLGMSISAYKLYEGGSYDQQPSKEQGKYLKRLEKIKRDLSVQLTPIKDQPQSVEIADLKKRVSYLEDQMKLVMKLISN